MKMRQRKQATSCDDDDANFKAFDLVDVGRKSRATAISPRSFYLLCIFAMIVSLLLLQRDSITSVTSLLDRKKKEEVTIQPQSDGIPSLVRVPDKQRIGSTVARRRMTKKIFNAPPLPLHHLTNKTFCAHELNPVLDAFISRNYTRVGITNSSGYASLMQKTESERKRQVEECLEESIFIYLRNSMFNQGLDLKVWQRPNYSPNLFKVGEKAEFVRILEESELPWPKFFPESYRLCDGTSSAQFLKRLPSNAGDEGDASMLEEDSWVLKRNGGGRGSGITFLGQGSQELKGLQKALKSLSVKSYDAKERKKLFAQQEFICGKNNHVVQKYVKDLLTYRGRKFTIRSFFPVVSVDPLVVLFHRGYLHVSPYNYNATDFSSEGMNQHFSQAIRFYDSGEIAKSVLEDGSQSFDDFIVYVKEYLDGDLRRLSEHIRSDPASHILSQIKAAFADIVHIFRNESFVLNSNGDDHGGNHFFPPENAYTLIGTDFFVDKDLKAWLVEANMFPSVEGERSVHTHRYVLPEMVDLVSEIYEKQMNGQDIFPLERLNRLELIYTDDFQFKYDNLGLFPESIANMEEQASGEGSWAIVYLNNLSPVAEQSAVHASSTELCQGLTKNDDSSLKSCQEASSTLQASPLRCIIVEQSNNETIRPMGAKKIPTFSSVMERVDWGYAIVLLLIVVIMTHFNIGVKHQQNQYLNNCLYFVAVSVVIYITTPNEGYISSNSILSVIKESYRTFTIVHPMSSPWIAISHFATYWFKIASWRAKSIRNMLFWQLLVEWVSSPVNEFAHHLEEQDDIRCMRMAFISTMKHFAVDDVIRVYVVPPLFVYGYLLPKFVFHWTIVIVQWLFSWV